MIITTNYFQNGLLTQQVIQDITLEEYIKLQELEKQEAVEITIDEINSCLIANNLN